ncbi:hypothetical protein FACS1894142_8340 [Spirochaetia bacterium]|nr:hypothetical protein FACS1894142_8340 [Spirochaetia bacterium]GHU59239.1 hypothetical protein FACS189444_4200 [Spirochaetia bacterium]
MNRKSVFSKAALAAMLGVCLVFTACPLDIPFTGKPTISGTPKVGQTLTAGIDELNGTGTPSYQWEADGTDVGANQDTYQPVADDVGKTITVTVSYSGNTGSQTSDPTATVTLWTNDITLSASSLSISRARSQTALITGVSGVEYSNHQWSVNGSDVAAPQGTAPKFSFSSAEKGPGKYNIGLHVKKDNVWYSPSITITVTD